MLETKGYRGLDAQIKASTRHDWWVPGVNAIGGVGRWTFAEFRDVYAIKDEFERLVADLLAAQAAH